MKLTDYFDRVVLLSLAHNEERRKQALSGIKALDLGDPIHCRLAWHGDSLPAPAWWRAGNGAWGCLQSHVRALSEAWDAGAERVLVLEDDVCWQPQAAEMLEEFIGQVPGDWGQIYLGGQHQWTPEPVEGRPAVLLGVSINRTHAYAVRRETMPPLLAHVMHAPDYIQSGHVRHIDHQLEVAHQRRDWRVYCPSWWIAGQEENRSGINGRYHPRKWWHYAPPDAIGKLPFIIIDEELGEAEAHLHRGWTFEADGESPKDLGVGWTTLGRLPGIMREIAGEALGMQRLPALAPPHRAGHEAMARAWKHTELLSAARTRLAEWCGYPRNGLFQHPWLNP